MFKHTIPWNISGEDADEILDEVLKIEPDAFLEIVYIIHHKNPDKFALIESVVKGVVL